MPWCPKCGSEYRDGYTICADCSSELVDQNPNPPSTDKSDIWIILKLVIITMLAPFLWFFSQSAFAIMLGTIKPGFNEGFLYVSSILALGFIFAYGWHSRINMDFGMFFEVLVFKAFVEFVLCFILTWTQIFTEPGHIIWFFSSLFYAPIVLIFIWAGSSLSKKKTSEDS